MATRANARPDWRAAFRRSLRRASHMTGAGVLFALLIFLALALASYSQTDPSASTAASGEAIANWMGASGAWAAERALFLFGLPSLLLRLRDGRLLMSYGYRRRPFGNQARISEDGGQSWSGPIMISSDGPGHDLGYPSTIERDDGKLVTVWYEKMEGSPRAVLRQAVWMLES